MFHRHFSRCPVYAISATCLHSKNICSSDIILTLSEKWALCFLPSVSHFWIRRLFIHLILRPGAASTMVQCCQGLSYGKKGGERRSSGMTAENPVPGGPWVENQQATPSEEKNQRKGWKSQPTRRGGTFFWTALLRSPSSFPEWALVILCTP